MSRREVFFAALDAAVEVRGALLMGICNLTPDSFSDGGLAHDETDALHAARARGQIDTLLSQGADVLDLGGESTRPGARSVSDEEQLRRLMPALDYALSRRAVVSIDTQSPAVARACLGRGAHALNDVSCLRDEGLASVVCEHDAGYVLMHARGSQEEMTGFSTYPDDGYGDVVLDVLSEWSRAADRAVAHGVRRDALIFDPGLGFSKNARQSAELLARTSEIAARLSTRARPAHPVLVGASRKSFLTLADKSASPQCRLGASVAAALYAVRGGARAVRVHDVGETRQALDLEVTLRPLAAPRAAASTSASRAPLGVPAETRAEEARRPS